MKLELPRQIFEK